MGINFIEILLISPITVKYWMERGRGGRKSHGLDKRMHLLIVSATKSKKIVKEFSDHFRVVYVK